MRASWPFIVIALGCAGAVGCTVLAGHKSVEPVLQKPGLMPDGTVRLHNGWGIRPAGIHAPLSDMPSLMAIAPDGLHVVVGTSGWHAHSLNVFEIGPKPAREEGGGDFRVRTEPVSTITVPNLWRGMTFGKGALANDLFVSGGASHVVWRFHFDAKLGRLREMTPISIPPKATVSDAENGNAAPRPIDPLGDPQKRSTQSYPGGLGVLPDGSLLVVDEGADRGPAGTDLLYKIDPNTGAQVGVAKLTKDAGALVVSSDGKKILVAEHGTGRVLVLRSEDLSQEADLAVGNQPNFLLASKSGKVYCANTGSDTVSVIDANEDKVVETIRTSLTPLSPLGSVPNALALSPDEGTLYVTNAGNNNVAVVKVSSAASKVVGFVPTGWYPVSVVVAPKNDWLFIGVGKGYRAFSNATVSPSGIAYRVGQPVGQAYGPSHRKSLTHDYIMSGLQGGLTRLEMPTERQLKQYTETVLQCSPYRDAQLQEARGRSMHSALPHEVGAESPIEHVLYIIKENRTYDQVLGDMAKGNGDPNLVLYGRNVTPNHHAIADEFVLLDNTYCDGEVSQDGWEWSTAANDSDWDIKATTLSYSGRGDPPGSRETIRPSNGYLWEWADKHGLTYFSYGAKTFANLWSPTWKGHFSEEWNEMRKQNVPDHEKADLFVRDLKQAEASGNWPNLVVMSLADDHTTGTKPGTRTPYASVGSNDLAIGKILDAVSHSKFWAKTAVFIIEDDAQNGPDHVDAHRTVALMASPYTRRGSVDHTMYTSSSLVRSIELCLGLPAGSQYDAAANAMFGCFSGPLNLRPYTARKETVDLKAINKADAPGAKESARLDFSDVDLADWDQLNHILWKAAKPGKPYPSPVAGFVAR